MRLFKVAFLVAVLISPSWGLRNNLGVTAAGVDSAHVQADVGTEQVVFSTGPSPSTGTPRTVFSTAWSPALTVINEAGRASTFRVETDTEDSALVVTDGDSIYVEAGIKIVFDDGTSVTIPSTGLFMPSGTTDGHVMTADGSGGINLEAAAAGAITALNNATVNEMVTVGATTTELESETELIFDGNTMFVGETANANMTGQGITIDQDGNDLNILELKSSTDIAHAYTGGQGIGGGRAMETDSYYMIAKRSSTLGGAEIYVVAEDAALTSTLHFNAAGGTASTTKTTAAVGLVTYFISEHNGSGTIANITADGNVFSLVARVGNSNVSRFMIDEDGDRYISGSENAFSDRRMKKNVLPIPYGLAEVMSIDPWQFDRFQQAEFDSSGNLRVGGDAPTFLGFMGQDMARVMPLLVNVPPDSTKGLYTIKTEFEVPVLWKAVQEQQGMIDSLIDVTRTQELMLFDLARRVTVLEGR